MATDCARRSAAVQNTADRSLDDFVVSDAVIGNDLVDSRTFAERIRAVIRGGLNEFG